MSLRSFLLMCCALAPLFGCGGSSTPPPPCGGACGDAQACVDGACVPTAAEDAGATGCAADADCGGRTPRCAQRHVCVECVDAADCASGVCGQDQSCARLPDSCAAALRLDIGATKVSVTSSTAGALDDVHPSCALGTGARDLVYRLSLPRAGRITAKIVAADPAAFQPVLALTKSCDTSLADGELGCSYSANANGAELSTDVAAGDYFLWVDGDSGTSGAFTLTVQFAEPVHGDYCFAPFDLTFDGTGHAQAAGTTEGFRDDAISTCGGSAGDVVYQVKLAAPSRLTAQVQSSTAGFYPTIYLRRPNLCTSDDGAAQLACATSAPNSPTPSFDVPRLESGTYYLFVDGEQFDPATFGAFQLDVTIGAPLPTPANDSCTMPAPIAEPASGIGTVTVTGDTAAALNDGTSGVCGGSAADLVYALQLTEPRKVIARLTPSASTYRPVLYVRAANGCANGDPTALLGCNSAPQPGATTTLTLPNLPAGESYLWVDGLINSVGAFSLSVEFAAPDPAPSNDSCAAPAVLSGSGGAYTVVGTTSGASDDAQTCTYPAGAFSADVVYQLDVAAPSSLTLDVRAETGSSLRPVLSLRQPNACGSDATADSLACVWPDPTDISRASRIVPNLPAGSYFLWVDGDFTTQGAFQLQANLGAPIPAPANDSCNTATALQLGAGAIGDTRGADNTTLGHCGNGVPEGLGAFGNDVVFQFDNAQQQTRTVTVVPDAVDGRLFRPIIYVRGPGEPLCGDATQTAQLGCAAAPSPGAQATLQLQNLPAGRFSVWVDGAAQSSGRFTVKVQ